MAEVEGTANGAAVQRAPSADAPAPAATLPPLSTRVAILSAAGALYAFSFFHRVSVPGTIFNQIQVEFACSASLVTSLSALFLSIYGGAQFVVGPLVDRLGGMTTLLWGSVLLCLGALLFPLAHTLPLLFLARAVLALGCSVMYLCLVKEIDRLFGSRNFAPILGILAVVGYLGGVAGTLPFASLVERIGWRESLVLFAILSMLTLAAAWVLHRRTRTPLVQDAPRDGGGSYLAVVRNRAQWPVIFTGCAIFADYFVVQTTLGKKFLEDQAGLDAARAASLTLSMMFALMAAVFASTFLSRLMGNRRKPLLVGCAALALAGTGMLLWGMAHPASGAGLWLTAFIVLALSSGVNPIVTASIRELSPAPLVARAVGFCNGLVYFSVAILANGAGFVLDRYRPAARVVSGVTIYPSEAYRVIFTGLFAIALAALVVSFFTRETRGVRREAPLPASTRSALGLPVSNPREG